MPRFAVTVKRTFVREYEFAVDAADQADAEAQVSQAMQLLEQTSRCDSFVEEEWAVGETRVLRAVTSSEE